jgi:hypothetical protein
VNSQVVFAVAHPPKRFVYSLLYIFDRKIAHQPEPTRVGMSRHMVQLLAIS